ncbi:MAG: hypothetical protein AAFQ63_15545 [Cyanobacteria bacterium J06621_11]
MDRHRPLSQRTNVGGVAEAVLRGIDPELVARARDSVAQGKALERPKPKRSNHQEQPKQHQKKRAKERDQGMEF